MSIHDAGSTVSSPFLHALAGGRPDVTPVWLMRQAGRYLPEYRALRAKAPTFMDFCRTPELAAEATLQPIRRFNLDAAIIFSDILIIPDALGQSVSFETGEGPKLDPIDHPDKLDQLSPQLAFEKLEPVFKAITLVKQELPASVPLIGFCGAPWTVASYMIAGRGTPDQAPARLFAYKYPHHFEKIINLLCEESIKYINKKIENLENMKKELEDAKSKIKELQKLDRQVKKEEKKSQNVVEKPMINKETTPVVKPVILPTKVVVKEAEEDNDF